MAKFRKKPVVIEAFQMTKERREDNSEWPVWLHDAWNKDWSESMRGRAEGRLRIRPQASDRHVTGCASRRLGRLDHPRREGRTLPCKPDIFEATYDREPEVG